MANDLRFAEYCPVAITEPLRQGDILEKTSSDGTAWNRTLLVITADCDFANDKHSGRVTCVPLLSKEEYLLNFVVPKMNEDLMARSVSRFVNLTKGTRAGSISSDRLRAWPSEQSNIDIMEAISVSDNKTNQVAQVLDSIRCLNSLPETLRKAVDVMVATNMTLDSGADESAVRKKIAGRFQNAFKQTPGDALFISAVAEGYEDGYFAYLRHLEQVREHQIALGPSHIEVTYRRLSRMQDRFIHAVAQRFALVFMSIGLPSEYEDMRNLHSEFLAQEML